MRELESVNIIGVIERAREVVAVGEGE